MSLRHGQRTLILMQMFSTLGFSVLFSTLILYATEGLHLSDTFATALVGSFLAFNYGLHVLGGYIGGRFLSYRGLFVIGMILQAIGCVVVSVPREALLIWGLALFLAGCGLNVICINCMLTQLFDPEDSRREGAFLWNYSSMNLGFFIGFSMSGYFQLHHDYRALFLISSLGSLISFFIAIFNWKHLQDRDTYFSAAPLKKQKKRTLQALGIIALLILALSQLLEYANFSNALIVSLGILVFLCMWYLSFRQSEDQSRKMRAFLILTLSSMIFWTLYQMAPMGLTLFYTRNVNPMLGTIQIPPQWLANVNSTIIILGGPLLAYCNRLLRKRGYRISLPFQFITAMVLIGIGFLLLPTGIHFANAKGMSSMFWVVGCYFFQSIGELFISPVGYAMVGQLIPSKLQGLAMGTWLMVTGVAAVLSNYFSQLALKGSTQIDPLVSNPAYAKIFLILGLLAFVGGICVFCIRSLVHRLIQKSPLSKPLV